MILCMCLSSFPRRKKASAKWINVNECSTSTCRRSTQFCRNASSTSFKRVSSYWLKFLRIVLLIDMSLQWVRTFRSVCDSSPEGRWTPTTPPTAHPHLTQPNLHNHNIRHLQREKHHQWILMTQRCGWAHQCCVKTLSGMKWRNVDYTQPLSAASQISFALMHFNKTRTRGCWEKQREPLISSSCVFLSIGCVFRRLSHQLHLGDF